MNLLRLLLSLTLLSAVTADGQPTVRGARYVMGSIFEITVRGLPETEANAAMQAAFAEIRRADEILSHYRDDSELSHLNAVPPGQPLEVHPHLAELLSLSTELSSATDGAFRVTVAPLVELWKNSTGLPSESSRAVALTNSRPDCYRMEDGNRVTRLTPECRIEFGAIGKGWAVDRALEALRSHGVEHALVSASGSTIGAIGDSAASPGWPISIRDPNGSDSAVHDFVLTNAAVSTSAANEQFRVIGGRQYGHILDPRTGWPARDTLSATVIAPSGAEADALSTAVFVLGPSCGAELLKDRGREGFIAASKESAQWKQGTVRNRLGRSPSARRFAKTDRLETAPP